jgi:hypothetical protein
VGTYLSKLISKNATRDEFGVVRAPELVRAKPGIVGAQEAIADDRSTPRMVVQGLGDRR